MEEQFYYSAAENTFVRESRRKEYDAANSWPGDAVAVEVVVFQAFGRSPSPDGKLRVAGADNMPAWSDPPPVSDERFIGEAGAEKTRLLAAATQEISILQDTVDAGLATDAESERLAALRAYRIKVNKVDTSAGQNTDWPPPPEDKPL